MGWKFNPPGAATLGGVYQAKDATLTAWAALGAQGLPYFSATDVGATLTLAADKGIYATGAGALSTYDLTAVGRTLLAASTVAAQRAALSLDTGNSPTFTDLHLSGNLFVAGTTTVISAERMDVAANYVFQNTGYTADSAQTGGVVVNYDPTTTTTNIAAGGFVAGVAAVSNPTVTVASTTGFATADIIQVAGSTSNDGFYEVLAVVSATVLRVRGIGLTACVESWSLNQFTAEAGTGTVTKVAVSILRTGTDGLWETGKGSTTPITYTDIALGSGSRTYAPAPDLSALASGLRVDPLDGARVELAPAIYSFPTISDLLTSIPRNAAYDNSGGFATLAISGGVVNATMTGTNDFSSAAHSAPFLSRIMTHAGMGWRFTVHISGTMPSENSQGIGIGIWDGKSAGADQHTRTARIAVYYTGSATKIYSGYGATETSSTLGGGAGDVTTGVWLEIEGSADGSITTRYQVGAHAADRPSGGWTDVQTASRLLRDLGTLPWNQVRYGIHGLKTAGSNFTLSVSRFDDTRMAPGGRRSSREGVGLGVSASSPEITLIDAAPVDWTVCTQARLRAVFGAVATQRDGEDGTAEFQVDGGSWVAASSLTVGVGATTTIKGRLVSSDGLKLASLHLAALGALRLT